MTYCSICNNGKYPQWILKFFSLWHWKFCFFFSHKYIFSSNLASFRDFLLVGLELCIIQILELGGPSGSIALKPLLPYSGCSRMTHPHANGNPPFSDSNTRAWSWLCDLPLSPVLHFPVSFHLFHPQASKTGCRCLLRILYAAKIKKKFWFTIFVKTIILYSDILFMF